MPQRAGWRERLQAAWWQVPPSGLARMLWPLTLVYRGLLAGRRFIHGLRRADTLRVPVIVVGNVIVGGAGKTPTVIALVDALRQAGWRPAVISRGHGSARRDARAVARDASAADCGDEPLLIRRRGNVPVWVGTRRAEVAQALCAAHPEVDVIVSDDGLQHWALPRVAEVVVFDRRGIGNGWLLPAGPLREPMPERSRPGRWVLYNGGVASTSWPGALAQSRLSNAWPLQAWAQGERSGCVPIGHFIGTPVHAAAGIAEPERFFSMLRAAGLSLHAWPMADHDPFVEAPWPSNARDVLVTEKDAVKLAGRAWGGTRIWVLPLDFSLPDELRAALLAALEPHRRHEP